MTVLDEILNEVKSLENRLRCYHEGTNGRSVVKMRVELKTIERIKEMIEKAKDGRVDAGIIGTKWTSVDDAPLADIEIKHDKISTTVTYDNFLVGVDMMFAVPLGNGEYSICIGYIEEDGSIQESFKSGDSEWWGYSLEDVTHYIQITNPK